MIKGEVVLMITRITLSKICVWLGLFFLFRPSVLIYYNPNFQWVFFGIAGVQIICACYLARKRRCGISKIEKWVIAFYGFILLNNLIHNTSIVHCLKEVISIATLVYSLKIGSKYNNVNFFKAAYKISLFFTTINTISAILFPESLAVDYMGAASIYILGGDNGSIRLYLFAILFRVLMQGDHKEKNFPVFEIINIWIFSMIRDIATGVVVSASITFLLLCVYNKKVFKKFSPYLAILINAIFVSVFVVMQATFNVFAGLLAILGRNATLTSRTFLWSMTVDWIKDRPLFGYGFLDDNSFNSLVQTRTSSGLFNTGNPHNTYLTILLSGGIILLCIFIIILIRISRNCNKFDVFYYNIFAVFLFTFMFHAQVEGRDFTNIIFVSLLFYYFKDFFVESRNSLKKVKKIVYYKSKLENRDAYKELF